MRGNFRKMIFEALNGFNATQTKNLVSELIDNLYEAVSSYVNDVLFPEDEEDVIEDEKNNPFTTQSFQQYVNIADSVK